jgi:4-amino-4-deoxy-L-arabinose transferase-like glycosyltransferase
MATRPAAYIADRVAVLVLAIVAIIAAFTFRDYGLGWDDYTHSQYGDLLLKLYGSGFTDTRALSFVNLYKYGGGFDMASALAAKLLSFTLFETRRLMGACVGLLGLFVTWRLARRLGGRVAGVSALTLLATCPLYYGHMFINAKDAPFATAMIILLFALVRVMDEYPRPSPRAMVLAGVGLGLAFGSRILATVAGPYALLAALLLVIEDWRMLGLRSAVTRFGTFVWTLLPSAAIGYLIMGLLWPWSVVSPLNPLYAAEYFDKFFERPWRELYEGRLISVPDMPATYLPHLFALTLPLPMLALGAIGFIVALVAALRPDKALPRRASMLLVALAPTLPVVLAMIMRPALYNGLRHFDFVVPSFAVLGGLGAVWLIEQARAVGRVGVGAVAIVAIAGVASPVVDMVRLHPYQYVDFNPLAGGVTGARKNYMLDYWGLAFKQASEALRAELAAKHEQPPDGRRWVVAICGPQAPADVELGPQFETTWEEKRADFAMSLGTFYCEDLSRPVLADIVRAGVSFARVYDLRGRPMPELVTEPPP